MFLCRTHFVFDVFDVFLGREGLPSRRAKITTTGTTTPVAALSFVVKPDEMFPPAELVVELEEVIFEAEDTNVAERNGSVVVVENGVDVPLTSCIVPI